MPSIFDDTAVFKADAEKRFKEAFEMGQPGVSQNSSNKQADLQNEIKQLKVDNANLRHNLWVIGSIYLFEFRKLTESRLNIALSNNSKLKETIEELRELSRISPVKPSAPLNDEKTLIKPYLDEIAQLRSKLLEFVSWNFWIWWLISQENPDATRIVRFTRSNPVDEALKRRASSRENQKTDKHWDINKENPVHILKYRMIYVDYLGEALLSYFYEINFKYQQADVVERKRYRAQIVWCSFSTTKPIRTT